MWPQPTFQVQLLPLGSAWIPLTAGPHRLLLLPARPLPSALRWPSKLSKGCHFIPGGFLDLQKT